MDHKSAIQFRTIAPADASLELRGTVIKIFQNAFQDSPLMSHFSSAISRPEVCRGLCHTILNNLNRQRCLMISEDRLSCGIVCDFPKAKPGWLTFLANVKDGFVPQLLNVPVSQWTSWFGFWSQLDAQKQAFADQHGRFRYVFVLATAPEAQGKGLGSAALRTVITEADEEELFLYIETGNERARALYERNGFVVHEHHSIARTLTMYSLVRKPVSKE